MIRFATNLLVMNRLNKLIAICAVAILCVILTGCGPGAPQNDWGDGWWKP